MTTVSGILEGYDGTPLANTPVDVIPSQVGVVGIGGTSLVRMKMSFITDATGLLDLGDLHPGGYYIAATVGEDGRKEAGSLVVKDQPSQTLADALVTKLNEVAWRDSVFVNPVLNGLVSGSAVQSSPTDATAGRLLTVGAFGWGNLATAPLLDDLDRTTTAAGVYYYVNTTNPSTANLGSLPSGAAGTGTVLVTRLFATALTQLLTENTVAANGGRTWVRTYNGNRGTWAPWRLLFDSLNILGTVSQTGGVPTGAIIEQDSNANGRYTRFADGTQICWHRIDLGSITARGEGTPSSPYATATADWTFPVAFSASFLPEVTQTVELAGAITPAQRSVMVSRTARNHLTQFTLQAIRATSDSTATNVVVALMAIGRWF
jgi:hypothetical protein